MYKATKGYCDTCKRPIGATQLKDWAKDKGYPKVANWKQGGTYLVYQLRTDDQQAHVFIIHDGGCYGNGNYDWRLKGGITTSYYELKAPPPPPKK
jgi:hypothetical protein